MIFSPRFVTTVASLAAPRFSLALLRIRGVTAAAAATATAASATATTATTRTTTRRNSASSSNSSGGGDPCVVSAALHFLEDKKRLLECLDPADYTAVDAGIGASVGGHVRHSLDHFEKLVTAAGQTDPADVPAATPSGVTAEDVDAAATAAPVVRYDRRVRGGSIEKDPTAAIQVISSLLEELQALPRGPSLRAKRVAPTFMLGGGGGGGGKEEFEFESNLERELFFCCHHGTHHDAMIQLILRGMGEKGELALRQAGKGFGVAPSTVAFLNKQKEEEEERRKHGGG